MPGLPAARKLDLTQHTTPLSPGPGSPNVIIGKQPAWRANVDTHVCSYVSIPPSADGPGVVLIGSTTVYINKQPACRVGDIVQEVVPNPIILGENTVLIGG